MTTIFIRTIIIYIVLLSAMRLMGKRQIGELEISDLITTLLVSELASLPITDTNIPISHAIIPIIILLTFEVVSSALLVRFPIIRKFISTRPTTLIKNGRLSSKQMKKVRVTASELISELRQHNITDINEVEYAILEQNGKISVIQKPEYRQPTLKDLSMESKDSGVFHIVIENGYINKQGCNDVNMTEKDIVLALHDRSMNVKDIFLMLINDRGKIEIIRKEEQ